MSGKDIWTTEEGREMCRHGNESHSLNLACPDSELCVCKHGESEHNRTQCWHVLWADGSHHEICRCTGYRVRHSKPPLVLPITPGSVIEATVEGGDGPQLLMLDATWCNRFTEANEDELLSVVRILFDAGAAR